MRSIERATFVLISCVVAACSSHGAHGWEALQTEVLSCDANDCILDMMLGHYLSRHPTEHIAAILPIDDVAHRATASLLVLHTQADGPWPRARDIEEQTLYGCDPTIGSPVDDCKKAMVNEYTAHPRPYLYWFAVRDRHTGGISLEFASTTSGPVSTGLSTDIVSCLVHVDHEARQAAAGCRDSLQLFLASHPDERIASVVPMTFSPPESDDYQTRSLLVMHAKDGPWPRASELAIGATACDPDRVTSQCTDGEIASHPHALSYALWFSVAGVPENVLYLYRRD